MKCVIIRWWMEEYIDGTLPEKRARWVAHHLQGCAACRQELAWRRSLRAALQPHVVSAPSQEMWLDFQRRLAQRSSPAPVRRVAWWQWGAASAAVMGTLVIGVVWWSSYRSASEEAVQTVAPSGQQFASATPGEEAAATGSKSLEAQPSITLPLPAAKPVHSQKEAPLPVSPSPIRVAAQPSTPTEQYRPQPPQAVASIAYAEVRNERGDLLGKVMVQTTYDETGKPTAILVEADTPAVVEVDDDEQPMDSSDDSGDSRGSAGSPTPTAGTRPGLSD